MRLKSCFVIFAALTLSHWCHALRVPNDATPLYGSGSVGGMGGTYYVTAGASYSISEMGGWIFVQAGGKITNLSTMGSYVFVEEGGLIEKSSAMNTRFLYGLNFSNDKIEVPQTAEEVTQSGKVSGTNKTLFIRSGAIVEISGRGLTLFVEKGATVTELNVDDSVIFREAGSVVSSSSLNDSLMFRDLDFGSNKNLNGSWMYHGGSGWVWDTKNSRWIYMLPAWYYDFESGWKLLY